MAIPEDSWQTLTSRCPMTLANPAAHDDRPVRVALFVTALAAAWLMAPRAPIYWDSFGYVAQALTGHVGGLALGRPVYVLVSHVVAHVALGLGASVWQLEGVLRGLWLPFACLAPLALHELARTLGVQRVTAALAGLLLATSPAFADTAGAVLTDAPAITAILCACWLAARASRDGSLAAAAGAGVSLGVAIGLREQSAVQGLTLVWMLAVGTHGRRIAMISVCGTTALVVAAVPVAWVAHLEPEYLSTIPAWVHAMQHERTLRAYGWHDAAVYLAWLVALGPLALFAALWAWSHRTRQLVAWRTTIAAFALPAAVQLVVLGGYQDISYSPRYLLPAVAGALCLPAAFVLSSWTIGRRSRGVLALALIVPLVVGAVIVRWSEAPLRRTIDALPTVLSSVPAGTVIVTGAPCPAIALDRILLRRDPRAHPRALDWDTICPGWTWPVSLDVPLERALRAQRMIVADLRSTSWPGGQQNQLRQLAGFVAAHPQERASGQIRIW